MVEFCFCLPNPQITKLNPDMDPAAGGGRGRSRRGGRRGFSRPGPGAEPAGSVRPSPDIDGDHAGGERGSRDGRGMRAGPRGGGGEQQRQRGGPKTTRMVWRPVRPQAAAPTTLAARSTPLDDDDILGQILIRLPPLPSSLPRAAAVCKRWQRLVTDRGFLRRFSAHHRKAPLLGFFSHSRGKIRFTPVLTPPDRISPAAGRLSLRLDKGGKGRQRHIYSCRHGRVVVANRNPLGFLVWDPVSGDQRRVPFPSVPGANKYVMDATVVCAAAGDPGHVHGACHSSPFQVILLGRCGDQIVVCVYSSETSAWDDAISLPWPTPFDPHNFDSCNTLVGNSIYWLLNERSVVILEFDMDRQSLATIEVPSETFDLDASVRAKCEFLIMPAAEGELGFLILSGFNARLWKRKVNCTGFSGWVLSNTARLDDFLPLKPWAGTYSPMILGLAEDDNVMFLLTGDAVVFMIHLEFSRFKKLPQKMGYNHMCYPFTSFYAAGMDTIGRHGVEITSL